MSWDWYNYSPSLSVAEQRRRAEKEAAKLAKKGTRLNPVCIEGRKIANSFWGKAWCDNLESYSDYESRLPRGRSYVRHGCVIDLQISECCVKALVSGSEVYKVSIQIKPVLTGQWEDIKTECAGQIGSLIDLLQGKLSGQVMEIVTRRRSGLFPAPSEIRIKCSCPDSARLCKHAAAVLYGVGARLDEHPELLFLLRNADERELITEAAGSIAAGSDDSAESSDILAAGDLADVFGIDLDTSAEMESSKVAESEPAKKASALPKRKGTAGAKSKKPATKRSTAASKAVQKDKPEPARKAAPAAKSKKTGNVA